MCSLDLQENFDERAGQRSFCTRHRRKHLSSWSSPLSFAEQRQPTPRGAEGFVLRPSLRVVEPMTLMTVGLYNEPAGAYLASVLF